MSAYWPFIVIGIFIGSIYALGALGLVLTYKTTGVFNFAYGAVAMFCAYIYWQLHDQWGITAWLALPLLVLVAAPVIGLVFEALFRPLAGLTAEIPIVVCLAMLALAQVGAPLIWGGQERGLQAVIPTSTFRLSTFHVGWDQLGTLVIACLAAGGLWWLLRHTRFGTATRAVVDNGDLASIIGVNGDAVRRTAWVVSSMFAGLIGVLLAAVYGIDPNSLILIVLASMVPAVLGRLVSFPWAFGGALAIGVFETILKKWSTSGTVANIEGSIHWFLLFIFLVVLGGKLKEAGLSVARLTGGPSVGAPPMIEAESASRTRRLPPSVPLAVAVFAVAVFLPAMISSSYLFDTTQGVIVALAALSLIVLTGWAGQISLAQFSFVGVGAYAVGHLAGSHGQNFVVAALAGMGIALGLGVILGLPSLRLKGLYLALATFAFALIMDGVAFNSVSIGGSLSGITASRPRIAGISFASTTSFYELSLWVLGAVLLIAYVLRLGPIGRRLRILRDSPLAASTLGVNLTVTKLVTFAVCGAVAALAGALYGSYVQSITPTDFMWPTSIALLLYVVFSGRALLTGAVLAGGIAMIPAFVTNPTIHNYIQLGVALGVIGLGRNPEGTIALSVQEAKRTFTVLRPRPRRQLDLEPLVRSRRVEVGSSV